MTTGLASDQAVSLAEQISGYDTLTDVPTDLMMLRLAELTYEKRELEALIKRLEEEANPLEDIVKERMKSNGVLSQKVQTDDGKKMAFALQVKMYPKMLVSSDQVVDAIERLAMRLEHEGASHDAEELRHVLTIKGQSLMPIINRWAANSDDDASILPPELEGVVEVSNQYSLFKRASK